MSNSVEKAITAMRQEVSDALGDSRIKSEALQAQLDTAHAEIEQLQNEGVKATLAWGEDKIKSDALADAVREYLKVRRGVTSINIPFVALRTALTTYGRTEE